MGLQLDIKTEVMTTGNTANYRVDKEDVEIVDSLCLLGSFINNKGFSSQEIQSRLALARAKMKDLVNIFEKL